MSCWKPKRLSAVAAALLLAAGCGSFAGTPVQASLPPEPPASSSAPPAAPPEPERAVLMAAGDNLIHDVIYQQARRRSPDGGYDFAPAYERIAPLLAGADFAFLNQETVLAGEDLPPSSYPLFCSPTEVGEEMIALGFNLFSTANNHALDKGVNGIKSAGAFWDRQEDIAVTGCYRTPEERDGLALLTRRGITVALVAAAEHTNGLVRPADGSAGVLLLGEDRELLLQKLERARREADFVILSLHWGVEGSDTPSGEQRDLAGELAEAGADLILGHHSHVLQGGEFLETSRGRAYVAYSLGNFISAQVGAENMAGGLLRLELVKDPASGAVSMENVEFLPTVTHYGPGFSGLAVYPLSQYTPELAKAHGVRQYAPAFSYEYLEKQLEGLDFGMGEQG